MPQPRPDTSVIKRCSKCREFKPRAEFYRSTRTYDQLSAYCKPCKDAYSVQWRKDNISPEQNAAYSKKWRDNNPRRSKDHSLKSRYGIPLGTYERLLAEQNGTCAICKTTDPNGAGDFHIDHCHSTNRIRGLLCNGCNIGIGHLKHSIEVLLAAADYLTKGSSEG